MNAKQIEEYAKRKHPLALWPCKRCKVRYPYGCEFPVKIEVVKVIYNFSDGVRGAPPWTKPYNDSEILGKECYCMKCIMAEKMGIKNES